MELKPCQCGCAEVEIVQHGQNGLVLHCPGCHLRIHQKVLRYPLEWLRDRMIKSWNTRPIEDALISEREVLQGQLQSVQAELDGFKSGTKEGADRLKSELKRAEDERDALQKKLDELIPVEIRTSNWVIEKNNKIFALISERDALKAGIKKAIDYHDNLDNEGWIRHERRAFAEMARILIETLHELKA